METPSPAHSGVRRRVHVRTFKGWDDHKHPVWLEIDLLAHCGGRLEGRFIWTLVATVVATGWSESLPVITGDGASVLAAIHGYGNIFLSRYAGSMPTKIPRS